MIFSTLLPLRLARPPWLNSRITRHPQQDQNTLEIVLRSAQAPSGDPTHPLRRTQADHSCSWSCSFCNECMVLSIRRCIALLSSLGAVSNERIDRALANPARP